MLRELTLKCRTLVATAVCASAMLSARPAFGDGPADGPNDAPAPKAKSAPSGPSAQRNFYDVLEDVLSDFEYDLKNGQVSGLKDLAIRNVATSENIPNSFKPHLELAITERIMRESRTRVIQCLQCRSKHSTLNGDQVVISSSETNPVEMSRIAKVSGIAHFMDIAFSYQPSGIVLSMTITDPETNAILWSRSYNSETSRAAAFRRGVDFTQTDDARKMSEYQPMVQYRASTYYLFERDIKGYTGCLGFGFRMVERYDNRHKEVGFELDYLKSASSFAGGAATTSPTLYTGFNMTMLFLHSWNLIGGEENFNQARGSIFAGVGGTYASGFLGGLIRGGYEWRLAKHWAINANLGLRPAATAFVGSSAAGVVSGAEIGFGIGGMF